MTDKPIAIRIISMGIVIDENGYEIPSDELINYYMQTVWPYEEQ